MTPYRRQEILKTHHQLLADDNSNRKKPYRYRWNNEFQDEILARLLALNKQRHEEETLRGETGKKTTKSRGKKKKQESSNTLDLDYSADL